MTARDPAAEDANVSLGYRKASPLTGREERCYDVPHAFLLTPVAHLLGDETTPFARLWNFFLRLPVRGLVADRYFLGTPGQRELEHKANRVPAVMLRRFFFRDETDDNARVGNAMTPEAIERFKEASTWQRDYVFRSWLGCQTFDEVATCVDIALTSFERSVYMLMRDNGALFRRHVPHVLARIWHGSAGAIGRRRLGINPAPGDAAALDPSVPGLDRIDPYDAYWLGVPVPSCALFERQGPDADLADYAQLLIDRGLVLWATVVWRVEVARSAERALCLRTVEDGPATPALHREAELARNFALFRDTHLDLMTHVTRTRLYGDAAIALALNGRGLYPDCLRVLCIEEMPKLSDILPFANVWYDTGVKKNRETEMHAIVHVLVCKMMNQKCQMRELAKLVMDYSSVFPGFNRLFKLYLRCALLGNLPGAHVRPDMAARLRINAVFLYEQNGPSVPIGVGLFGRWLQQNLYTAMFLLRETLIYHIESDGVLDDIMMNDYRWQAHKRIVRTCNADIRRVLSHQASYRPTQPFDWSQLQRTVLNRYNKPKKVGITIRYHEAGLKANQKLRKARWEEIMLKKMTSCNTDKQYRGRIHFDQDECSRWLEEIEEALLLVARRGAIAAPLGILETRWLQVLGLTPEGLARLRRCQYDYYMNDVSDHSFVREIFALYHHAPRDYIVFRAYVLLVLHYRSERCFFLPLDHCYRQMRALRVHACIEPWATTPETLGRCYLCDRCQEWSNPIIEPPLTVLSRNKTTTVAMYETSKNEEDDDDGGDDDLSLFEETGPLRPHVAGDEMLHGLAVEKYSRATERLEKRVAQSTYMTRTWCDPLTGELACRRTHTRDRSNPLDAIYVQLSAISDDEDRNDNNKNAAEEGSSGVAARAVTATNPADVYLTQLFERTCPGRLRQIDMVGLWFSTKNGIFGLCDECGQMIRIENSRVTARGVSCLHHDADHARQDEGQAYQPGDFERWLTRTSFGRQSQQKRRAHTSGVLDPSGEPINCAFCSTYARARCSVFAYTPRNLVYCVPLCAHDFSRLANSLGGSRVVYRWDQLVRAVMGHSLSDRPIDRQTVGMGTEHPGFFGQ